MTRSARPAAPPVIVVLMLWLAGLGAAAQFGKMSVIYDRLGAAYAGAGEAQLGLIVSVVGMVGLAFGTTAGLLVARVGPRRAIVGAMVLGAAVSAVEAVFPPYPVMFLARVLEGVSHLAIVVVGPVMIAAVASDARRPLAMTLWSSFFGVTYAVLALIAPPVLAAGGVAALFLGHAGWMLLLAAGLALVLPRDGREDAARATAAGSGTGVVAQHVAIYTSARIAAPAMGFCCYTFLYVALLTLLPKETPAHVQGLMAAGMPLVSIAVSLSLGVWLLGRMPAVRLVQWGYVAAVPGFLLLALFWGQAAGMVLGGFWMAAALGIVQGASFAAIPELNATAADRARAAGAVAQLGNLGTTSGTPVLAALLATAGGPVMALCAVLFCLLGLGLHAWQARRRQRSI